MLTAALAIAHQVAGKSVREGLFLSTFKFSHLPHMMLGSALGSIPVVLLVARLMTKHGPAVLTPVLFVVSALLSAAEWALLPVSAHGVALAVYLHVSIGGALLVSAFWSLVNERFDPHALKHWIGRITACATLGGLVGGLAIERIAHWLGARSTLPVVAMMCVLAAVASKRLAGSMLEAPSPASRLQEPVRFSGYLWTLALLSASTAAASSFADFSLKHAAVDHLGSAEQLVRFFAVFYTAASLLSFLLQALVARSLFAAVGLGGTLAVAPTLGVGFGALAALAPSFLSIGALRGADMALGPSLFKSAFEPLFTPLPSTTKRATKSLIDVVFDKGGDACASSLILLISLGGPLLVERAPLLLATFAFALALLLSLRARQGYVAELEASLRAGTVSVDAVEAEDPAAHRTLSSTTLGLDRDKLREEIERARRERAARAEAAQPPAPVPPAGVARAVAQQVVEDVRTLLSTDTGAIRGLLGRQDLDPRLAAFVVPLLADDLLVKPALTALRAMGQDVVGVLADVMLSDTQPLAVRRRVPHVLRTLRGPRVASALRRALTADSLQVRYRAALALLEVARDERELMPESEEVFALALHEIGRGPLTQDGSDHVFALLSLCTARGSVELVRQALKTDDRKMRGTALEYLESLLPETVRAPLVQALAERPEPRTQQRTETQLLEELRRSIRADVSPQTLASEPD